MLDKNVSVDPSKDISVVIGFRNWGIDRLVLAVKRLVGCSLGPLLDVVISDYGSDDEIEVRAAVEAAGGRVVRTQRAGTWSRSRALNAGVRGTNSRFVVTTDADMIFTSDAVRRIRQMLLREDNTVHLVQCRDLVPSFGVERSADASDEMLEQNSRFRPRWGMGGLIAFERADFDVIGGYDERMQTYGGEDMDFAQRLVRAGRRLNWVDDPAVRIFHIWHPRTPETQQNDPVLLAAQKVNLDIRLNDKTWLRNVNVGGRAKPVASVLIATHNRADYLLESIDSTLAQSIQDIEVIILDDGSTDNTREVLNSIKDARVRYLSQENCGVARTRNRLVAEACSSMIVVHDDDDIMLPWRIEAHLDAMTDEIAATYGGWVNFENATGVSEVFPGKNYSSTAFIYGGTVLTHGTSMFRTEVLRRYPYREHLRSGVDFNLITRLANARYNLRHTGQLHILRRMHDANLTRTNQSHQKRAATRIANLLRRRNSPEVEKVLRQEARDIPEVNIAFRAELQDRVLIYLPDHLARRQATISYEPAARGKLQSAFAGRLVTPVGWADQNEVILPNAGHADLAKLRVIPSVTFRITAMPHDEPDGNPGREEMNVITLALPDSGLIDIGGLNRIQISPLRGRSQPDLEESGVRRRHWYDGKTYYEVAAATYPDIEAAISAPAETNAVILFILPPNNTNDMRRLDGEDIL